MAMNKRQKAILGAVAPGKTYPFDDAIKIVKTATKAKFVESIDVAVRLGVDAKKSDQQVRGSTVLPAGTGKSVRVAVFCPAGAKADEALAAVREASRFDPDSARQHAGLIAALPFIPVSNSEIDAVRGALQTPTATDCVSPEQSPFTAPHEGLHEPIRLYVLGHLQARVEAFDLALATAEQLAALAVTPIASPLVDDWSLGVRAHVAWRQGLPRQALALLERTLLQISYTQRLAPSPFLSQNFERYLRAHLLEMADREEDALRWYECVTSDFVHEIVFLAPSYLRRAEIHDRRGDYAQARDFYQRFIALWSGGEPEEAAVVARAQQRLIRLGGHVVREPHLAARAE